MHFSATRTQPEGGRYFWVVAILGVAALLAGCNGKDVSIRDAQPSEAVQTAEVKTGWSGKVERKRVDTPEPALAGKESPSPKPDPEPVIYPGPIMVPEPDASDVADNYGPISKPAEPLPEPPQKLTWHPPLTREDGTSLYPGEIAGYRIYYKKAHLSEFRLVPLNDPTDTDLSLDSFSPGVYHFAISTIDVNGLESRRSAVVKVNVT